MSKKDNTWIILKLIVFCCIIAIPVIGLWSCKDDIDAARKRTIRANIEQKIAYNNSIIKKVEDRERKNLENPEFKEICLTGKLFVLHKDVLTQVFTGGGYKRGATAVGCINLEELDGIRKENKKLQKELEEYNK